MSEPVLEVSELHKVYAGSAGRGRGLHISAVDGVSFELARGGALGVVGESGSGKTTVARILVGLEQPTSGDFRIAGVDPRAAGGRHARRARARLVQMVFQDPYSSFDPRLPVADSIERVLALHFDHSESDRNARVSALLDMVGLDDRRGGSLPQSLSGGERQRAAIARALAVEPRLLILDEAVAALDVSIQAQILNLLVQLRRETAVSYLFLTHDLAVVRQVTDDVIVMREGAIVERGETRNVLANPQHPYTRLLLDCVPHEGWKPRRTRADRDLVAGAANDDDAEGAPA